METIRRPLVLAYAEGVEPEAVGEIDFPADRAADPEVMRYITGGRATPREQIGREELPALLANQARSDGYGFWAAVEKASGEFIGWFHLRPRADGAADEPELGYRLRRSAWGKGYATEGSRALIENASTDLGADRVWAETMVVHTASQRVMEKAGLKYVRMFHADWPVKIEGEEEGDVKYARMRPEWEERQERSSSNTPLSAAPHGIERTMSGAVGTG